MQEGAVSQVGTYAIAETWGRTTDQHGKPVPLNRQCARGGPRLRSSMGLSLVNL
jgi:hypothetical protein